MAHDRIVQYRPGLGGSRNDRPAEKGSSGTGSQCSVLCFLLPGSNRACDLRSKLKTCISICLRDDRVRLRGCCLCGDRDYGKRDRCRRSAGDPVHQTGLYGKLRHLYGDRGRNCFCIDRDRWKEKMPSVQNNKVPAAELAEIEAGAGTNDSAGVVAADERNRQENEKKLKAFLTGNVIKLKDVNDGVFSEGVMGDGFAIIPENDVVYAPADAKVTVLMQDSRHACGLTLANGMELLLHVGIDTVDMQGDGFEYLVGEDQEVTAGAPLIRFDRDKIKAAGHPDTTVCIITDPADVENIRFITGMKAEAKNTVVAEFD